MGVTCSMHARFVTFIGLYHTTEHERKRPVGRRKDNIKLHLKHKMTRTGLIWLKIGIIACFAET